MRLNEHTAVLNSNQILLVPYSEHHVPAYHEWMQDEELQKATASEPLTLHEEYAMQKSWREDADKLTFIVCTAPATEESEASDFQLQRGNQDSPGNMMGDINLFLNEDDEQDDSSPTFQNVVGEVEIMIARNDLQGKGLGKTILNTFMWYMLSSMDEIRQEWQARHGVSGKTSNLAYLRVKIDASNTRSIRLFESVGFSKIREEPNYFGELELRWPISSGSKTAVEERLETVPRVLNY
ncbi:N-acetyltransferase [Aaosphaeria arxii CBS 175.79]|uniref:N-acetyltransferase n=1 Tax=Aaosphaeria arxii CBS 175.79 TaxID=1450172 RepID=A0A6A5XRJ1_9PLEO|nr:N-acetyltransferase [Aaosphaeria arxii CBS 175.79]KAF2015925.1 N-acetyltransferase [Aaosphaeria arxii CBS 175.79]